MEHEAKAKKKNQSPGPKRRKALHFNWTPGQKDWSPPSRNQRRASKRHARSYPDRSRIFNRKGIAGPLGSLGLTRREIEVLTWITQGKTNYEIGVILGASTRTVCKHVQRILNKLKVENRTAAAAIAIGTLANAGFLAPSV